MDGGAAKPGVTSTVGDWPGVQGATLEVDMNQTGGKGRLVIARGTLFFPGAFEDPLPMPMRRASFPAAGAPAIGPVRHAFLV